jgi:hypothetical protein
VVTNYRQRVKRREELNIVLIFQHRRPRLMVIVLIGKENNRGGGLGGRCIK